MNDTLPRVFIGIQEISGYYGNLEAGFLELGIEARFVQAIPHPFEYPQSRPNPKWAKVANSAVFRSRSTQNRLIKLILKFIYGFSMVCLLFWALPRFNTFIFSWGMSFLPLNIDLYLLNFFKKKTIVVVGHGSEARPPYMSHQPTFDPTNFTSVNSLKNETLSVSRKLERLAKRSDFLIGLRTTAHFIDGDYVDIFNLGVPALKFETTSKIKQVSGSIRKNQIIHLPSNSGVKGTAVISSIFSKLSMEFPEIEFKVLQGISHNDALNEISQSLLVVDQLWSDIPMSMIGIESGSLGIPSLVSGYSWELWESYFQTVPKLRKMYCEPEQLENRLRELLLAPAELAEYGTYARDFLYSNWTPTQVASRYAKVINGDDVSDWVRSGLDTNYIWGCGASRKSTKKQISSLIKEFGFSSLRWHPRDKQIEHILNELGNEI